MKTVNEESKMSETHTLVPVAPAKSEERKPLVKPSINKEVIPATLTTAKYDNCVSKFAFATKTGYQPSNPNKVNQDSFLALPHLAEYRRTHFFAVCDGHGLYGKEVSEYIR